jgi:hypothetical protein
MRGDLNVEALLCEQVGHSASEPLQLSPVNSNNPCVQHVSACEDETKCRNRFAVLKAWRGIEGWHVWNVALGTWEVCSAKAFAEVGRGRSSNEAGNDRRAKGLYLQNETMRIGYREECNGRKTHKRGQSAGMRRVTNRSCVLRSIRWNQCETMPKGKGERNQ